MSSSNCCRSPTKISSYLRLCERGRSCAVRAASFERCSCWSDCKSKLSPAPQRTPRLAGSCSATLEGWRSGSIIQRMKQRSRLRRCATHPPPALQLASSHCQNLYPPNQAHLLGVALHAAKKTPAALSDRYAVLCLQLLQQLQASRTQEAHQIETGFSPSETSPSSPSFQSPEEHEACSHAHASSVSAGAIDVVRAAVVDAMLAANISSLEGWNDSFAD